jgi:two-component system, OmpR family, response regulator ResD
VTQEGAAPRVLVVDGDENILRLLGIKLAQAGFDVTVLNDGSEALAAQLDQSPDIVLLGDNLPSREHHELAGLVATLSEERRPAVVFLSRSESDGDIAKAFEAGCDDYIVKPFSPRELVHRLKVTLIRRRKAAGPREAAEPGA